MFSDVHKRFTMSQTVPHNDARELDIVCTISRACGCANLSERLRLFHHAVVQTDCGNVDALLDDLTDIVRSKLNPRVLSARVCEVRDAVEARRICSLRDSDMFCLTCLEGACAQVTAPTAAEPPARAPSAKGSLWRRLYAAWTRKKDDTREA